jgi:catechol 2,3-dioxygenase-like lactoylglutathione lyase family enzyme
LRVDNIEQAVGFYTKVFGATQRTPTRAYAGSRAEEVMGGNGTEFRICHLQIGHGIVELFEFVSPKNAQAPIAPFDGRLIHFGIRVRDVAQTLDLAESVGASRLSDIRSIGDAQVVHMYDPDHNVIEITTASIWEIVQIVLRQDWRESPPKNLNS